MRITHIRNGLLAAVSLSALMVFSGCGKKKSADNHDGHDHDEHAHEESATGSSVQTTFKEGSGLVFPDETKKALKLTTVEAGEKPLKLSIPITAQVFRLGSPVLATASLPIGTAALLEGKTLAGARIVRIDRSASAVTGEAELILALESKQQIGDFVSLTLTIDDVEPVVVIPRSALLRTTTGTFAYVANGAAFLRTPVVVGKSSADEVEITDGLYSGDVVVSHPVEQLWLAELRFTKGGGHSH